jgi:hypothetical protein
MAHKLAAWTPLWNQYPDYLYYSDSKQVKKDIGGSVDQAHLKNTCAIRLSRTLNYNGLPLQYSKGMVTKKGADGKRYAIRVREIRTWLMSKLGKPEFDVTKKEGEPFDKTKLSSMKGIIGFDIRFSDATGHLDLWDGTRFSSEHMMTRNYWNSATRIWLWEAGK